MGVGHQTGGPGFGGLKVKNLALLAEWGWRYMDEENSLCARLLEVFMVKTPITGTRQGSIATV